MPHPARFLPLFATLLTAALMLVAAAPASAASLSGTPAWSTQDLVLRNGPGTQYRVTGAIASDAAIKVLRCQRQWCNVDGPGGRGWTSLYQIDFGRGPAETHLHYSTGQGTACFYEGANYTGASLCISTGQVIDDMALLNADNRFQSLQITGNASVAVCRDRKFQSYCERILISEPVLHQYLRGAVSSARVY